MDLSVMRHTLQIQAVETFPARTGELAVRLPLGVGLSRNRQMKDSGVHDAGTANDATREVSIAGSSVGPTFAPVRHYRQV